MIKNIRQSNEDKSRAGSLIYMECKAGRKMMRPDVIATKVSNKAIFKDSPSRERSFQYNFQK